MSDLWPALWTSGRLIDVALFAIAAEFVVFTVRWWRTGRGMHPLDLTGHLLAGALLLGAVRSVVVGAPEWWTWLLLSLSFPVHVFDLVRRTRAAAAAGERDAGATPGG